MCLCMCYLYYIGSWVLFIIRDVSFAMCCELCVVCRWLCVVCRVSCVLCCGFVVCVVCVVLCVVCRVMCALVV